MGAMATTSSKQYMASCPTKPITHCVNRTAQNTRVKKTAQNQSYTVWKRWHKTNHTVCEKDSTEPITHCVERTARNQPHTVERTAQNQSHSVWKGHHKTNHTLFGKDSTEPITHCVEGQHKTNHTLCGKDSTEPITQCVERTAWDPTITHN